MNNQGIFGKLDESFAQEQDKNKMYIIFVSIAILVGYIIFDSVNPIATDYLSTSLTNNQTLTSNLNKEKAYLQSVQRNGDKQWAIKNIKREIQLETKKYNEVKDTNSYIDKKIRELSYLLFDDKNWANFLDSISETAKKFNVKVLKIKNKINKITKNKPQQILNLEVSLKGNYHGVVKFINALEESVLIVDIYNIKLEGKSSVEGVINIAVWGLKY